MNSLWFIWSVISCSIALGIAIKITSNSILQGFLIIFGIFFVSLLPCWEMNVYMYPFFVIGYLYSKNKDKLKKYFKYAGIISSILFCIMLHFFQNKHYIYVSGSLIKYHIKESIMIDCFRWAIGLFGSIAVIWICKFIYSLFKNKIMIYIEKMGEYSLALYALSVSILSYWLPKLCFFILSLVSININKYIWIYNLIITPLVAVCYSVILLFLVKLMKKIGIYKLIFGR